MKRPEILFVAPRQYAWDVRVGNKLALSARNLGFNVELAVRKGWSAGYLGMGVTELPAPIKETARAILNAPAIVHHCLQSDADVFVMANPDALIPALILRLIGKTVIYDTHDDYWRRARVRNKIPAVLRFPYALGILTLEWIASRICRAILVTQERLLSRYGSRAKLVDNAPLLESEIIEKARHISSRVQKLPMLRLGYAGILSENRFPELMLEITAALNHLCPTQLRLVGWSPDSQLLENLKRHPAWKHVDFTGYVPHWRALAEI